MVVTFASAYTKRIQIMVVTFASAYVNLKMDRNRTFQTFFISVVLLFYCFAICILDPSVVYKIRPFG